MLQFLEKIFGCFHNWGKWYFIKIRDVSCKSDKEIIVSGQERICQKCGKIQLKEL